MNIQLLERYLLILMFFARHHRPKQERSKQGHTLLKVFIVILDMCNVVFRFSGPVSNLINSLVVCGHWVLYGIRAGQMGVAFQFLVWYAIVILLRQFQTTNM